MTNHDLANPPEFIQCRLCRGMARFRDGEICLPCYDLRNEFVKVVAPIVLQNMYVAPNADIARQCVGLADELIKACTLSPGVSDAGKEKRDE
jgi:hypothetical protein